MKQIKPGSLTTIRSKVLNLFATTHPVLTSPLVDQETVAKLAEVDMIIADLDRANSRVAALEHRNVSYRSQSIKPRGLHSF